MLDLKNIIILAVAFCNFALGSYVFWRGRTKKVNRSFGYLTFSVVSWCLIMIVYRLANTAEIGVFWAKLLYLSAACIAYVFLLFTFIFPFSRSSLKPIYKIFLALPFIFIGISSLIPSWIVKDVILLVGQEKQIIF